MQKATLQCSGATELQPRPQNVLFSVKLFESMLLANAVGDRSTLFCDVKMILVTEQPTCFRSKEKEVIVFFLIHISSSVVLYFIFLVEVVLCV